MERQGRIISYRDDFTPIGKEESGKPVTRALLTQTLESIPIDEVGYVACQSVKRFKVRPQEAFNILNFIGNKEALDQFRVWAIGKGYRLQEEDELDEFQRFERARQLLSTEEELITHLSPYVTQLQMARIVGLRRYREADEQTKQTLVSGTYRLLGEYLGPRRFYKRDMEEPKLLPLPDLPIDLFEDGLVAEILTEAQRTAALEIFNQSVDEGFAYLDSLKNEAKNPVQIQFVENLENYFKAVDEFKVPGFKKVIAGSQKDIPADEQTASFNYPSFHQKEYAYRFIRKTSGIGKIDLLVGDTGTQKTGAAIYAMEAAGAKTTLVVCPPGNTVEDWAREIEEKYDNPVDIVKITGSDELRRFIKDVDHKKPRYIIIGFSLLSTLGVRDSSFKLLSDLVQTGGVDSLIDDESHLANEYDANCTQLFHIISKLLPQDAPRIAMTATAIVNGVEDLDSPVRILLPFDYPNEGDFTTAARNDPYLVSALLYGRELLTRWNKYSILKGQLPELTVTNEPVPITLFHQALYDFVYRDNLPEGITKRQILRQLLLDPMLIRKFYSPEGVSKMQGKLNTRLEKDTLDDKTRAKIEDQIKGLTQRAKNISALYTFEQAQNDLSEANRQFVAWKLSQNPDEVFDEDFLSRIGLEKLAIWAFFNFPNGVDSLIATSSDRELREYWQGKDGLYSSKYLHLKRNLEQLALSGQSKVLICSAFYKTSVTTPLEETIWEDDTSAFFSLYDYLRIWFGDERTLRIDGDISAHPRRGEISEREAVRRSFRLDPTKDYLLVTMRSSRLGINLTIPPTEANKGIRKVYQYHMDEPDTYADKKQMWGRSERPGQEIPIEAVTFRATHSEEPTNTRYGFLDQGIAEALEYKKLIAQMVLDGIPLTEDEESFVKAHTRGVFIQNLYPMTPKMYLLNRFFPSVRGQGYEKNRQFLKQIGFEGLSNADFFATYYPKDDEYSMAANNARVVSQVIRKFKEANPEAKIASVGSGGGILQIMLGEKIVNIDMMEEILRSAKGRQTVEGQYVAGNAATLPILSEMFDIVDFSLAVHWTNNKPNIDNTGILLSERARVFKELNRSMKMGGKLTFSVPHNYMTDAQFLSWTKALEGFGFKLIGDIPSGEVWATDFKKEPISWIFNVEKISQENIGNGYDSSLLNLESDAPYAILEDTKGAGEDLLMTPTPPVPHREFIIKTPQGEEEINFGNTPKEDKLERDLARGKKIVSKLDMDLAHLGVEEYGVQRRLLREALRRWAHKDLKPEQRISFTEAEELAFRAMEVWSRENKKLGYTPQFYGQLRSIMLELREEQT